MFSARLQPHPAAPAPPPWRVEAEVLRTPGGLALRYSVAGAAGRLRLPTVSGRRDGLWQHTCFEAFLQPAGEPGYREFNFAPSGAWAAYEFDSQRKGMRQFALPEAPMIGLASGDSQFGVAIELALPPIQRTLHIGLAAVLEDLDGRLSHWALVHHGSAPDFHDPASFTLQIA